MISKQAVAAIILGAAGGVAMLIAHDAHAHHVPQRTAFATATTICEYSEPLARGVKFPVYTCESMRPVPAMSDIEDIRRALHIERTRVGFLMDGSITLNWTDKLGSVNLILGGRDSPAGSRY